MKVYVLLGIASPYEGEVILGIFSKKEDAENKKEKYEASPLQCSNYREGFYIEEYDVL